MQKFSWKAVHGSTVYNDKNLKTAEISNNKGLIKDIH